MTHEAALAQAREWIARARQVAVLTGAGVSAESGVPTFRDAQTGLWARYRPEEMATEAGFRANPALVYAWYEHRRALVTKVQPNAAHRALAAWAQRHPGRLSLITQNVDGLHQRAGSPQVNALHGELMRDRWLDAPRACCRQHESVLPAVEHGDQAKRGGAVPPVCPECGNLRRPGVVWFGEALPPGAFEAATEAASSCDVLLVVGTAGAVYPAAGLAGLARTNGAQVVIVNPHPSEIDHEAHLTLRGPAARVVPDLLAE